MNFPEIPKELLSFNAKKVNYAAIGLKDIFQFPEDDIQYGLAEAFKSYLTKHGIPEKIYPAGYELYLIDIENMELFYNEPLERDKEMLRSNGYLALLLSSSRRVYDIGMELERIEIKHRKWGRSLLSILGNGFIDCLTPSRLWEEGEKYYSWLGDPEFFTGDSDCYVHPNEFVKYYPEWAFIGEDIKNIPPGLAAVPSVREYKHACNTYCSMKNYHGDDFHGDLVGILPGAYAAPAVIGWTKGRNEIERDPAVIASDEEIMCAEECEGCNPGAEKFEFLLMGNHRGRNLHEKRRFDLFLDCLVKFENLIDWIKEEGAA